ncbi:MAG: hypothetical protein IIC71_09235, partial [Acidobacteria bacterium]|nr:hypothetical protein [Acidobacteriota bacterium]
QLRDEVIFDFVQATVGSPSNREETEAEVVARVVVSVGLATRIQDMFAQLNFSVSLKEQAVGAEGDAEPTSETA